MENITIVKGDYQFYKSTLTGGNHPVAVSKIYCFFNHIRDDGLRWSAYFGITQLGHGNMFASCEIIGGYLIDKIIWNPPILSICSQVKSSFSQVITRLFPRWNHHENPGENPTGNPQIIPDLYHLLIIFQASALPGLALDTALLPCDLEQMGPRGGPSDPLTYDFKILS